MKEFIKNLPITTFILVYLFFCGSLYLVGFWTTFEIDVTNFITITEIPKSFVIPFLLANGIVFFQIVLNLISSPSSNEESQKKDGHKKRPFIFEVLSNVNVLLSILTLAIIGFYNFYKTEILFWTLSSILFAILISIRVYKIEKFKQLVPTSNFRKCLINIFVVVPVISFSTGKINSLNIYHNKKINLVEFIKDNEVRDQKKDTFKLLGFVGDKIIISDLKNKKIQIINQSSFDEIQLIQKDK
jgi:NADH:ubiquinone oxidoreductase subunit 5 (subunit L)/multisubunit Na+/H+ antiporter MnhA subunit